MKTDINRMVTKGLLGVITASFLSGAMSQAATVSTPYENTYSTPASTNDFAQGAGPANKASYVTWSLSNNMHYNLLNGAGATATLYGWATVDFQDLGGIPTDSRNFITQISMLAKSSVTTTTNKPGGFQGICALASDADLGSYYYGRVYFTNYVGNVILSKFVDGVESLIVTTPTTIVFDRARTYNMSLIGSYTPRANPALTLTYNLVYNNETNTVTLVDEHPLSGTRFGYRSCNNSGTMQVYWDNLRVSSTAVIHPGTIVVLN